MRGINLLGLRSLALSAFSVLSLCACGPAAAVPPTSPSSVHYLMENAYTCPIGEVSTLSNSSPSTLYLLPGENSTRWFLHIDQVDFELQGDGLFIPVVYPYEPAGTVIYAELDGSDSVVREFVIPLGNLADLLKSQGLDNFVSGAHTIDFGGLLNNPSALDVLSSLLTPETGNSAGDLLNEYIARAGAHATACEP